METDDLKKALEIRNFYNNLRIGYNGTQDCNSFVGPGPFRLDDNQLDVFTTQGDLFRVWLKITIELCTRAYRDNNFRWLGDLVEGESPENVSIVHRQAHLSGDLSVPLFARPDMSSVGTSVEVQIPGSGWGYQTAIHNTMAGKSYWLGPVDGLKNAMIALTGSVSTPAAYVLYNQSFLREVEYLCRLCQEAGMQLQMYFQSLPSAHEVSFVRRPPLEDFLSYSGGSELIQAWSEGKLLLEPGPSLLFDQKLAIIFPFHPLLREFYPDSVRKLFPETFLVAKDTQLVFDGKPLSWDELCDLSQSKRQFILKYAGAKKGLRAGGKAVYNLSDCNHQKVKELLSMAFQDWNVQRSPWLIQRRIQQKYPVTFLDHRVGELQNAQCYGIFRPMYCFLPNEQSQIISLSALFRKEWKVHGSSDAVMLPVEV